jgi:uncharacterized protein YjbI with pentapeptide repeats
MGNLGGVNLHMANLIKADLSGADFSDGYLSGANLYMADLGNANLYPFRSNLTRCRCWGVVSVSIAARRRLR